MARITLTGPLKALAGGLATIEIDARNVRQLLSALDERFPALGAHVRSGMAIAIDGEILHDAPLEPLEADSEVHFLPAVGGG